MSGVVGALAIASAPTGCSGDKQLDVDGAMEEIRQELDSRFRIEAASLDCPEEVALERGATFECSGVDQRGRPFAIEVEQLNDSGRFTFSKPKLERRG